MVQILGFWQREFRKAFCKARILLGNFEELEGTNRKSCLFSLSKSLLLMVCAYRIENSCFNIITFF